MCPVKARTALRHVVPAFVLVAIVALVTICFNILGTLACSILTGMLLGASRQWKWHIIPVSLIFPAAMLSLLEFSKEDIPARTRGLLSVLSWGSFLCTYLLSYVLVYFERHGQGGSKPIATQLSGVGEPPSATGGPTEAALGAAPCQLTLRNLQGEWIGEALPLEGRKRILKVAGDEMALWVTDPNGQGTCEAKGRLRLD